MNETPAVPFPRCTYRLWEQAHPRTCQECGLGPCKAGLKPPSAAAETPAGSNDREYEHVPLKQAGTAEVRYTPAGSDITGGNKWCPIRKTICNGKTGLATCGGCERAVPAVWDGDRWREGFATPAGSDTPPSDWIIEITRHYRQSRGRYERANRCGYTNDINQAGRFTEAEAMAAQNTVPEKCHAVRWDAPRSKHAREIHDLQALLTAAQKERDDWKHSSDTWKSKAGTLIHDSEFGPTPLGKEIIRLESELAAERERREVLAARVSVLFEIMDAADDALDKDTYDEVRRESAHFGRDIPADCAISITYGTRSKINKVFLAIDQIRNSLK